MKKNTKLLIKHINEGKNLKENIPIYLDRMMNVYRDAAGLDLAMEYYTLFEMVDENLNPYLPDVKETMEQIHHAVNQIAVKKNRESFEACKKQLGDYRKEIMNRMQELTAYIDRLLIYEYVLNRIEFRVTKSEEECTKMYGKQEERYIDKLVRHIFDSQDNMVINEKIQEVIGQLPVRMTKAKYFELVTNSLSAYNGADKTALDSYLYVLRTSSMLYEPEGNKEYFIEFKNLTEELEQADYKGMGESQFHMLHEKLQRASVKMIAMSELYIQLQKLINGLYAYVLTEENVHREVKSTQRICENILKGVFNMFKQRNIVEDIEGIFDQVSDMLYSLEGRMEETYEERTYLEAFLFQMGISYSNQLNEWGLQEKYGVLINIQKLFSTSLFIDLEKEEEEVEVETSYIEECAGQLLEEMKSSFETMQKPVMRAVMAATISKMPVFFSSSQELLDYITHTFTSCSDKAEKLACIDLLDDIMEGWL